MVDRWTLLFSTVWLAWSNLRIHLICIYTSFVQTFVEASFSHDHTEAEGP